MSRMVTHFLALFTALFTGLVLAACSGADKAPGGPPPTVLAASSLQGALDEAADAWAKQGHAKPVLVYAASSALARQAESGADGDLFISADEDWMDTLDKAGLVKTDTREDLLGNTLVLIAPAGSADKFELTDRTAFFTALGKGPLSIADPAAVPAGKYGKAALLNLRLWEFAEDRLAPGENVRAALALVERGEAPLGIVYGSDAQASDKVRVVATFPETSHPAILYPAAVLKTSKSADAQPFLEFLGGEAAQAIFAKHGFSQPR
ncbi:MAG: molybdate ABC transporter substrate-binding protein [Candidatus Andeanibacterium colombiense]|uniref:Molybdate ABC transporter substrate-binding protein n=1 Tax=Candidatus Andeanibacterium colombiense TaxID=3121345 RepID=A0AAJ6BQG0_9SPHN|nr:MAG: molybdate ABC transporter substrate-binding protein [Sphingomonadaceae bacterium]